MFPSVLWHFSCLNFQNFVTQLLSFSVNPLNPHIKIQIPICYPCAFSIEEVERIC